MPREPLPPPLPPESRTVGQLVAEAIRLYGANFWRALPLGLSLALTFQLIIGRETWTQVLFLSLCAPLLTASYIGASMLVGGERAPLRTLLLALVAGTVALVPATLLLLVFILPAVAWLALVGFVVPVAVIERTGFRESFRRAVALARADYVHALGGLATLTIVFFLTALMLGFLLRGQGEQTLRVAAFLAHLVLSPMLFLGAALLYVDQAARVVTRPQRRASPPEGARAPSESGRRASGRRGRGGTRPSSG